MSALDNETHSKYCKTVLPCFIVSPIPPAGHRMNSKQGQIKIHFHLEYIAYNYN